MMESSTTLKHNRTISSPPSFTFFRNLISALHLATTVGQSTKINQKKELTLSHKDALLMETPLTKPTTGR
jgi:hypothetical protein